MGAIDMLARSGPGIMSLVDPERIADQEAIQELNVLLTNNGRRFGCKAAREIPGIDPVAAVFKHLENNGVDVNDVRELGMLPRAFFAGVLDGARLIREEEAYMEGPE